MRGKIKEEFFELSAEDAYKDVASVDLLRVFKNTKSLFKKGIVYKFSSGSFDRCRYLNTSIKGEPCYILEKYVIECGNKERFDEALKSDSFYARIEESFYELDELECVISHIKNCDENKLNQISNNIKNNIYVLEDFDPQLVGFLYRVLKDYLV